MNVTDFQETWQVDVGGQIYEAKFAEMAQWIYDGSLLPQDMVRRGNLRWIEARKVPTLLQFFNARENGLPPISLNCATAVSAEAPPAQTQNFSAPQVFSSPQAIENQNPQQVGEFSAPHNPFDAPPNLHFQNQNAVNFQPPNDWQAAPDFAQNEYQQQSAPLPETCVMHADTPGKFVCDTCANVFCKECPKSFGGTVKICPFCGAMCRPLAEIRQKRQQADQYQNAVTEGFGIGDFFEALAYPFKYKTSLFFGAVMFMFFTLGQAASGIGGMIMGAAALICFMLSNMLTFGILANTVENFAQGKITANFMPSFDDFSIWEDVVHPFFLSLGVYIVSFGLLFLIIFGGVMYSLSAITKEVNKPFIEQSERIGEAKREGRITERGEILMENEDLTPEQRKALEDGDMGKLQKLIQEQRQKEFESLVGKNEESEERGKRAVVENLVQMGFVFLVLGALAFLWGIFYIPAACCVAAYTRSFVATMNPTIGLETIKLLGWDYVKLWGMGLVLYVATFVVGFVFALILFPFNLPGVGNLPALGIASLFTFYVSVVYSVILGFALYKNADKLNLFKG